MTKRRRGREHLVCGNIDALRHAARLLDELEACWRDRRERFGSGLEANPTGGDTP